MRAHAALYSIYTQYPYTPYLILKLCARVMAWYDVDRMKGRHEGKRDTDRESRTQDARALELGVHVSAGRIHESSR